ncbi:Mediator of RNA polymerase II transcription subunit 27 [Blattella germanica]|nr:Mediator of RNA polymerase II transcription subunit 27 [Blattella germanica]
MMESALYTALNAVKVLRSSVGQVFDTLGNGLRADHGEDGKDTKFLFELQELLSTVNINLRDVEQAVNTLSPPPGPFNLGNTTYLSQESTQDRQALYSQLVHSYKWTDKMVLEFLRTVDNVINTIDRLFADMSVTITRPFATNALLQISLGRVLKAVVAFKGLMIEWVVVKGHGETLDLWTESRHKVFRKVTENAHAAMLHFSSPNLPELAVRSFMTWFHSYITLFSDPCKRCGNYLHSSLPPTWRQFQTLEPYHEECKPSFY